MRPNPVRSSPSPACSRCFRPPSPPRRPTSQPSPPPSARGPTSIPIPPSAGRPGPFYALAYLVFAAFGASLVAIFAVLPAELIVLAAGLALLGALANALAIALEREAERMAAVIAFVVTASGLAVAGVGSAFWGLIAGLAVLALDGIKKLR